MPLSFSRLSQRFINNCTPYEALAHLIPAQTSTQIKIMRISSVVLALLTIGVATVISHLFCKFRYRQNYVALRPEEKKIYDLNKPFEKRAKLDLSSLEQYDRLNLDHFLASRMSYFTQVSCYKPCGYTEFLYSQFCINTPSHVYQSKLKACKEGASDLKRRCSFDNATSMKFNELGDEYWAAHPESVGKIGRLNLELIRSVKSDNLDARPLLEDFKRALTDHNDHEAALCLMELAKIPNSLPYELFCAFFGDVRSLGLHPHIKLTKQLHELKKLALEFKDHRLDSIRSIVSFYTHAGYSDPIATTKVILKTLDPVFEYAIHDNKLYKVKS